MLREDDLVPLPTHLNITTAEVDIIDPFVWEEYTYMTDVLTYTENNDNLLANLYSCPVLPQSSFPQLYISYGFKEDLFYLFTRECYSNRIEFKGLVELTPLLDMLSSMYLLETRFYLNISIFSEWDFLFLIIYKYIFWFA